jgi:hypothetical protein
MLASFKKLEARPKDTYSRIEHACMMCAVCVHRSRFVLRLRAQRRPPRCRRGGALTEIRVDASTREYKKSLAAVPIDTKHVL